MAANHIIRRTGTCLPSTVTLPPVPFVVTSMVAPATSSVTLLDVEADHAQKPPFNSATTTVSLGESRESDKAASLTGNGVMPWSTSSGYEMNGSRS